MRLEQLLENFDVDSLITNLFIKYNQIYRLWQLNLSRVFSSKLHFSILRLQILSQDVLLRKTYCLVLLRNSQDFKEKHGEGLLKLFESMREFLSPQAIRAYQLELLVSD